MCGIAGIHRLGNRQIPRLDAFASALLDGIEERGTDATGYVAIDDAGGVQIQKASCRAYYFNLNRARIHEDARTVLLHTRWATQGKPAFPENNHPVEAGGIYAVHNGHIHNDAELFHEIGAERRGRVDSEAIPAIVAHRGWASLPSSLEELEGDLAVALINVTAPRDLVLARGNYSPLVYVKGDGFLVWASTEKAISQAWEETIGTPPSISRFVHMKEGDALRLERGKLSTVRWKPLRHYWRQTWATAVWTPPPARPLALVAGTTVSNPVPENEDDGPYSMRCDDCGNWFDFAELEEVESTKYGADYFCRGCIGWMREMGLVDAAS